MTKLRNLTVVIAAILMVLSSAEAQAASGSAGVNPQFAQLNRMLSSTADDLLAGAARPAPRPSSPAMAQPAPDRVTPQPPVSMRAAVDRVRQLRPIIDPILRQQGVPPELTAVVLVESGGHPAALSPKGARGLWQLMPDTARRYGLIVSEQRDERLDLVSSTRAAARYLHDLYAQFGDWRLALAAYNAGEQAVHTAIQRAKTNSFIALSQMRLLPAETRTYVPAVLTASSTFAHSADESGNESTSAAKVNVVFAFIASDGRAAADGSPN